MGFVASVRQPSTFRMLICPEASSAQNNIAAVSASTPVTQIATAWRYRLRGESREGPTAILAKHIIEAAKQVALAPGASYARLNPAALSHAPALASRRS